MSASAYITISCDHEGCECYRQVKTGNPQEARAELKKLGWIYRKFPRPDSTHELRLLADRGRLPALRGRSEIMRDLCPDHTGDRPEVRR